MKPFLSTCRNVAGLCLLLGSSVTFAADSYPTKSIDMLIGAAPGGGTDAIGRVLAEALSASLKKPVIPMNKAGASGTIASEQLIRSAPDGYTLVVLQNGHTVNPAMLKQLPYDTFKDFTPISPLGRAPLVLTASSQTGVKTFQQLIELGKKNPSSMTFGASEASTRLATEMIGQATGIPVLAVNYKGTGPAMSDLAGGHVNFSVTTIASTLPLKDSGKMNYIAVLAPERSAFLPDVPTLAEQGYPNIETTAWWGVLAPAKMPNELVAKLNTAVAEALHQPAVKDRLHSLSIEPWSASPDAFDRFIRSEVKRNIDVAEKAGLKPD